MMLLTVTVVNLLEGNIFISSSKEMLFSEVSLCQSLPMLILARVDAVAAYSPCAL